MKHKIAPGDRFGRLIAVEPTEERRHGQVVWLCRCDCGAERRIVARSLIRGATKSCGCLRADRSKDRRLDLTGQRFGRLVATSPMPDGKWLCTCDCGHTVEASRGNLCSGKTRSCGCLRTERVEALEADREAGWDALRTLDVDGTNLAAIAPGRRANKSSATGVRGVSPYKGRFRATITLRRKQYDLGAYDTIEEAADARRRAEQELFVPVLERHGRGGKDKS